MVGERHPAPDAITSQPNEWYEVSHVTVLEALGIFESKPSRAVGKESFCATLLLDILPKYFPPSLIMFEG